MAATLAQLEAQLDALDKAYHSGVLTARDASGSTMTFRSMTEMQAARTSLIRKIAVLNGTTRSRVRLLHQSDKGL